MGATPMRALSPTASVCRATGAVPVIVLPPEPPAIITVVRAGRGKRQPRELPFQQLNPGYDDLSIGPTRKLPRSPATLRRWQTEGSKQFHGSKRNSRTAIGSR